MITSTTSLACEAEKNSTSCLQKTKSLLFCRFSMNWQSIVLVAITVLNVIAAVTSFFAGQIIWGIFFSFSGVYLSILNKRIADFTNLHNASNRLKNTNQQLRKTNSLMCQNIDKHKKENSKLRSQVKQLEKNRKQIEEERKKFTKNNENYESLLKKMNQAVHKTAGLSDTLRDITDTLSQKQKKQINLYIQSMDKLKTTLTNIAGIQKLFVQDIKGTGQQFQKLLQKFETGNKAHLNAFNNMQKALAKLQKERALMQQERTHHQQLLASKKAELEKVTQDLERANQKITDSSNHVLKVSKQLDLSFTGQISSFWKTLWGNSQQSAKPDPVTQRRTVKSY